LNDISSQVVSALGSIKEAINHASEFVATTTRPSKSRAW
jgi:hypothetical protein